MDKAVGEFGRALESELSGIEGKTKKEIMMKSDRVVRKWLDMPLQYRDPVTSGHVQLPSNREES